MKIRAGKKLWRRKPRQAPRMIAESAAAVGLLSDSEIIAKVPPAIPQTPAARPSRPSRKLTMFITATIQSDRQRHADPRGELVDAEEREREVVDPDAEGDGIAAASDLAAELLPPGRPRKSSIAPTAVATAAPSRMPRTRRREVEERERRDEDPEEDREPAEPRDRAPVDPRARPGVDDAEQAGHAADGRRQDTTMRARGGAPEDLRDGR